MTDPTTAPDLCSAANNCLQAEHHPDGSITLWSSRRPDQRITLDPDEVPGWLRPVDGDLRTLALAVTWQHYGRRTIGIGEGGYQATCQCGWESDPAAKRDEADAQHSNHLADEVRAALLPAHRDMVLDEASQAILDHADEHFPADGNDVQRRARRILRIAVQVVSPKLTLGQIRDELVRMGVLELAATTPPTTRPAEPPEERPVTIPEDVYLDAARAYFDEADEALPSERAVRLATRPHHRRAVQSAYLAGAEAMASRLRAEYEALRRTHEQRGLYPAALAYTGAVTSIDAALADLIDPAIQE